MGLNKSPLFLFFIFFRKIYKDVVCVVFMVTDREFKRMNQIARRQTKDKTKEARMKQKKETKQEKLFSRESK